MKLADIFNAKNGLASSAVEVLLQYAEDTIPYIRPASTQQRTIAGWVRKGDVKPDNINPSETIFVSTDGEGSHTYAYVSRFEFVANSNVSVLIPKKKMTLQEKIYYAKCITLNRYKFSYGRKPKGNRLKQLELPSKAPNWVNQVKTPSKFSETLAALYEHSSKASARSGERIGRSVVTVADLFDVVYGTNLELVRLTLDINGVNFVSRTSKNNGVSGKVKKIKGVYPIAGGVLSVAGGGSVLETFLQTEPFYSGRDLFYLKPKTTMSNEELLFYCACIRANQSRYSYGRQANRTLKNISIPAKESIPKWVYGSQKRIAKFIASDITSSTKS